MYFGLRCPQLFQNELDMMCIRKGNYVRGQMVKRSSIVLTVLNLRKGVSQIAGREGFREIIPR